MSLDEPFDPVLLGYKKVDNEVVEYVLRTDTPKFAFEHVLMVVSFDNVEPYYILKGYHTSRAYLYYTKFLPRFESVKDYYEFMLDPTIELSDEFRGFLLHQCRSITINEILDD